jgi:hypothetical protein
MPAGDRTGPAGTGPMTGRGAGYCAGYEIPGYAGFGPRMGMGWRRGWGGGWGGWGPGRGWRHRYYATRLPGWFRGGYAPAWGAPPVGFGPYGTAPTPEQETEYLRTQAEWLRERLDAITSRIEELEQQA